MSIRVVAFASLLLGAMVIAAGSRAAEPSSREGNPNAVRAHSGVGDFDFLMGSWRAHHRKLKARLANSSEWEEFDGTLVANKLMQGYANVDDNVFEAPGGTYRGVGLRAYDAKSEQWSIWWLDSRMPLGPLEPPVQGRFENGIGTFYADDTFNGKPIRVRYLWSHITATTARWEQAFSPDGGKTWETNWIMDFERTR